MNHRIEKMAPECICSIVDKSMENLMWLKRFLLKELETAESGLLRLQKKGNTFQYFHITKSGDTIGSYIPKSEEKLIKRLAQRDYYKKLLPVVEKDLVAIEKFKRNYVENPAVKVFEGLLEGRQSYISPITLRNEDYLNEWLNVPYKQNPYMMEKRVFKVDEKTFVRSKSEFLLATTFKKYGIPFRYEPAVGLENGKIVYPDFICLNVQTRQEFLWEHFGLLNESEYLEKNIQKIKEYSDSGYLIGKNLIVTMESLENQLDLETVENYIKGFLL